MSREELLETVICECGNKTIADAIMIFQNTTLPYKKAKKLVTGCDKSCCRRPLMKLYDMVEFGKIDIVEIARLNALRHNRLDQFLEALKSE